MSLANSKPWWDFLSKYAANDAEVARLAKICLDAETKLNERLIDLARQNSVDLIVERSSSGRSSFVTRGEDIFKFHAQPGLANSFSKDLNDSGLEVVRIVGVR